MTPVVYGDVHVNMIAPLGIDPYPGRVAVARTPGSNRHHVVKNVTAGATSLDKVVAVCGRTLNTAEVVVDGWAAFNDVTFCRGRCGGYQNPPGRGDALQLPWVLPSWERYRDGTASFADIEAILCLIGSINYGDADQTQRDWCTNTASSLAQVARNLAASDPYARYRHLLADSFRWDAGALAQIGANPGTGPAVAVRANAGNIAAWFRTRRETLDAAPFAGELIDAGVNLGAVEQHLDAQVNTLISAGPWWVVNLGNLWRRTPAAGFPWRVVGRGGKWQIVVAVPAATLSHCWENLSDVDVIGPLSDLDSFDERVSLYFDLEPDTEIGSDAIADLWAATGRIA